MLIKIKVIFRNDPVCYELVESRDRLGFKFAVSPKEQDYYKIISQGIYKPFLSFPTIREAMINAYRGGPSSTSVKPIKMQYDEINIIFMPLPAFDSDFKYFWIQGELITDVSFLNCL